ncbi:hypothetical protein WG899_16695 [Paucibacter sp. AS339]|uniref:hypothetical protein n=1 Tax=Paucibacter hankyongi TaxID=3133434 RepID=UPI003098955B
MTDAHLLLAHIAGDRGDPAGRCAELDITAAMSVGSGHRAGAHSAHPNDKNWPGP